MVHVKQDDDLSSEVLYVATHVIHTLGSIYKSTRSEVIVGTNAVETQSKQTKRGAEQQAAA